MPVQTTTTTPLPHPMSHWDQFKQATWACSLFFSTAFERTSDAFEKVMVSKRGSDGRIKTYTDQETKKRITQIAYIHDKTTGELYTNDEAYVVSGKCLAMLFAAPIYTLGTIAWHLGKIPFSFGRTHITQLPWTIAEAILDAMRAPFFGCAVEVSAIYGLVKPYHVRRIEALFEHAWQKGASYKDDFRKIPARRGEGFLEAAITDISLKRPFYLAHCFQPRGNTHERRIIVKSREPL